LKGEQTLKSDNKISHHKCRIQWSGRYCWTTNLEQHYIYTY